MFSAIGAKVVTLTGRPSRAIARVAAMTQAAPAMSPFMFTMLEEGLMVRPPESKVTPLPTSARWAMAPWGDQVSLARRERRVRAVADAEGAAAAHARSSCSWSQISSFTFGAPRPLVTAWCAVGHEVGQQRGSAVRRGLVDPVAGQRDGVGEDLRLSKAATASALRAIGGEHDDVVGSVVSGFADLWR